MAYHSQSTAQASTTSMQYFASSSMNSSEFYFSDDRNSVNFETVGITINDKNCAISFKINKKLAEGEQYSYKFLAFDDSNSDIYHSFDRENPTEEWQNIFYSHMPSDPGLRRARRRRGPEKVNLANREVVLITDKITSEFTSIEIEDFNVKACFHGIFIFFNKQQEAYSSWIVNYSHDEKIIKTNFSVEDIRTGAEEEFGRLPDSPSRRLLAAPLIKFYTTPYEDKTLGIIIFVDVGAFLQEKSWNSELLTAEEIISSVKNIEIIRHRLKNIKKENLVDAPSERVDLTRVDFNVPDSRGIVSYVARDSDYLTRREYEYEFSITIEDPSRKKVEKIFNELKSIHEALFSVKRGRIGMGTAKKYFAQIIDLASLWHKARTSVDDDHDHVYTVNPNNTGKALLACSPESTQICHQHIINDGVVEEAQSSCYPDCKDRFGVSGVPPHTHILSSSKGLPNSFAFIHKLATDTNLRLTMKNVEDVLVVLEGFLYVIELELPTQLNKLKLTQNSANTSANVLFSEQRSIKLPAVSADKSTILPIGDGESITGLRHIAQTSVESILAMSSTLEPPTVSRSKPATARIGNFREDVLFAAGSSGTDYANLAPTAQTFANSMTSDLRQGRREAETSERPTETFSFRNGAEKPIELEILTNYFIDRDVIGISDVWSPLGSNISTPAGANYHLIRIKNPEIVINKYFVLSNI